MKGISVRRSDLIGLIMRRNELANDLLKASTTQQLPPMLQVFVPVIIVSISDEIFTLKYNFLLNPFCAESKHVQKLSPPQCLYYLPQGLPSNSHIDFPRHL